ncbi:uncharacterized protein LOC107491414 [Arachis duranensis]|uniref:Uncharacterized protein LOC107491414 n=1 Tax=Arachis duranensis TaxID=130453 RepID=A0A6P4DG34_ARADU|nr:uncharacterized protein LOC107491414 [Arachis duranensis]
MAEEKDAFYVVKKGGVVGIYKSLKDIQPLIASSSVSDDPVSILKGYCLTKKAEEFLVSNGLKGAPYSISATNLNEELFGRLVACPYQDPCASGGRSLGVSSSSKLLQGAFQSDTSKFSGSSLHSTNSQRQVPLGGSSFGLTSSQRQLTPEVSPLVSTNSQRQLALGGSQAQLSNSLSCTLEFDGASKGNPGPAGAGAILRAADGSKVYRIREGVGTQTNNVAEYRALLLGLKQALQKGYRHIQIRGDSLLVCKQVNGEWKQKNQNMAMLCAQVNQLKANFLSFQINHVLREKNSEADAQANLAINLRAGQVEEDCEDLRR